MARYTADYRSTSRETYDAFIKYYPGTDISYPKYKEVIYAYNRELSTQILETGETISLTHGWGKISINRKITRTTFTDKEGKEHIILPIDWAETRKTGKRVHFFNDHTNGWKATWIWFKDSSVNLKLKDIWVFKPAKDLKLGLRDYMRRPDKHYYKYTEHLLGRAKNKKKDYDKL